MPVTPTVTRPVTRPTIRPVAGLRPPGAGSYTASRPAATAARPGRAARSAR